RRHTRSYGDWSSDVCSSDLLSAPRVTTKSGQRAVIEIVREFRYPTQFQAPQVPTFNSGGNGNAPAPAVVTPTTPTAFETRNTGEIGRASCRERVQIRVGDGW